MVITLLAKTSYSGGREFVKFNTRTKQYYHGNTASTAVSYYHGNMQINDLLQREIKDAIKDLDREGFTEFTPNWKLSKGLDSSPVYKNIAEAGL